MTKIFWLAVCLFIAPIAWAQRDTIPLNSDWQFVIDHHAEGQDKAWFLRTLSNSQSVSLPHTWNIDASSQNHYGWAWYQKKINIPNNWKSKNIVIQFGAINHTSIIYLNGKKIHENIGDGFSKFSILLNNHLIYGKENVITIAVNNDFGKNKVPYGSSFDWPNDGGLIRKVVLIVTGKPAVSLIKVTPTYYVENKAGKIDMGLFFAKRQDNLRLVVKIQKENQTHSDIVYNDTLIPTWDQNKASVHVYLPTVNPWHFDFPNLYKVDVEVVNGKEVADKISTVIGFREFKFVNGQFMLNGEKVKLMGVEWTAGSNPDFGFAETDNEIIRYCKLMKDVNTIFTRQHFQQDELFYQFCDYHGIIVQQEVPLWGAETPVNDTIRSIAMRQLESMIANFYNHPSIFSWGVGNELRGRDPDMKKFIADLLKRAAILDSSRFKSYVSNTLTWGFINSASFTPDAAAGGDYLMMNEYGGSWWDIPVGAIPLYLDSVHLSYPDKPFFISEFGLCEPNFKGGDERRVSDLIYHMGIYEAKPYIQGAIYFDLTDYRTHYPGTSDTTKFRRRIHGVYDMYGNPKPSMKVLRELSAPVEIQALRGWKQGKLNVLLFGSMGLPQHTVKGYQLIVSETIDNYQKGKVYQLPNILPGQRINFEIDDLFKGKAVITIVRPTGYVASQKQFD